MEPKVVPHCPLPFEEAEIHISGDVYTCCPNWNHRYSIGNIYESSFETVWNSEKAIELRKRIQKDNYSLCDKKVCSYAQNNYFETFYNTEYKEIMEEYPKSIKFAYDKECNIACKICRKEVVKNNEEELKDLNAQIDTFFLPMLKHAEKLITNGGGDPFGSRHSRLLIKKAAEKYPNLKFDFHTNGLLCNENNFKNLNIHPQMIEKIRISIHAATAKTYGRIVKNGEKYFPTIIKNLHYLGQLRRKYEFGFYIHMVVTADNYKEIPMFIELAKKVNASPRFWEFRYENCSYQIEENICITNTGHPKHNELLKVMQHPMVKRNKEIFSPGLQSLIREKGKFWNFFTSP